VSSEQRAVAGARRCPFYASPSVFLYKQMRCAGASASAIPFEFSLRRMFGGRCRRLEDWKSGSLQGEDDSCNCRHKDHQGADDSKIQTIKSNITSVLYQCPASDSAFNPPLACAEQSARTSGSKELLKPSQPPPPDHAWIPSPLFASKS